MFLFEQSFIHLAVSALVVLAVGEFIYLDHYKNFIE